MKQINFIADGKTKNFHFTFPFFLKSDIIIEVDSQPATKYNLICAKNGLNADIPFSGGCVQFNKPPKQTSVIRIKRKLPVKRIIDFQPTARYSATAHNQDMNYLTEVLKDIQDTINVIESATSASDTQDAIAAISGQIAEIVSELDEIRNTPPQPGAAVDLTEVNSAINSLTGSINTLNTRCNELGAQIENIGTGAMPDNMDYVVESQLPTAENNYTWYRKYASGWVEQGGRAQFGTTTVLPIIMADANYTATITAASGIGGSGTWTQDHTPQSFKCVGQNYGGQFISSGVVTCWRVSGTAAE